MRFRPLLLLFWLLGGAAEAAEPELSLPDPLIANNGAAITTPQAWRETRRPELLELFRTHVYGRMPVTRPKKFTIQQVESDSTAMEGRATRMRWRIEFEGPGGAGAINLLAFLPNGEEKPVPCFLLICHRAKENIDPTRETKMPFWPAERLIERGYATAAFHTDDVDPDRHDEFRNGVHGIFDPPGKPRPADAWATLAAWGWGASRALDCLETEPRIDSQRVAVVGHSRGGKASLWCGAEDDRFAMVVSNDSGCSGAALSRRRKGETLKAINSRFPHWFCDNYNRYNDREGELPVDQHQLIALIAPRLAYVASAEEDAWADPQGEFLSCLHASPVYSLLGEKGLVGTHFPAADHPLHEGRIGYHLRAGKHDLTLYDWNAYLDFADRHWPRGD